MSRYHPPPLRADGTPCRSIDKLLELFVILGQLVLDANATGADSISREDIFELIPYDELAEAVEDAGVWIAIWDAEDAKRQLAPSA